MEEDLFDDEYWAKVEKAYDKKAEAKAMDEVRKQDAFRLMTKGGTMQYFTGGTATVKFDEPSLDAPL